MTDSIRYAVDFLVDHFGIGTEQEFARKPAAAQRGFLFDDEPRPHDNHDVSDEKRDETGKWTDGGTSGKSASDPSTTVDNATSPPIQSPNVASDVDAGKKNGAEGKMLVAMDKSGKQLTLHPDGFGVTLKVHDGAAAGEYETDLHSLKHDTENGIWDAKRTINVNGVDKNLKLKIDSDHLQNWIKDWEKKAEQNPHECYDCGARIHGHGTDVVRKFSGSNIHVKLCPDCSDAVE